MIVSLFVLGEGVAAQRPERSFGLVGLQPGDVLSVTVYQHPELSGEFTIGADSTIRHVLYRNVKVVGVPLSQIEERLRGSMSNGRYFAEDPPPFVIEPRLRITVGGEIRNPNLYTLPRETTLGQAIALAGGPTESGRLSRVQLVRGGQVIRVDFTDPGEAWVREPIHSGDQLIVERSRSVFRDVVGPLASLVSAITAIVTLATR